MGKKFVPAFDPPRVVRGESRWYLLFYVTQHDGTRKRYRPTFNLNRIHNLEERARRGEELRQKIHWWLNQGNDPDSFDERRVVFADSEARIKRPTKYDTSLEEALKLACRLKKSDRPASAKSYDSISSLFLRWMEEASGNPVHQVGDVTTTHASEYLDHCLLVRKVGPQTYNNQVRILRGLFKLLVARDYLADNPFRDIPMRKVRKKRRRNLTMNETRIVARVVRELDLLLFYALVMQYACFLRPAELRRMRFAHVLVKEGRFMLDESVTKTGIARTVEIPAEFLPYFEEPFWSAWPEHWLIFGMGWKPHPKKCCGANTMNTKHRRILDDLESLERLSNTEGITWYSWKDTGITDALEECPPMSVKDQAGHHDLKMTLRYRHQRPVNEGIRGLRNKFKD